MIAKNVEECWQLAFDEAEDFQRQMNRMHQEPLPKDRSVYIAKMIELKAKRDMASFIARLIKHGEKIRKDGVR